MSGFAHRRGLWASLVFLLMVLSGQTSAQSCWFIISYEILEKCRQRADAGDTEAMLKLAEGYAKGHFSVSVHFPPDQRESMRYYVLAADHGDKEALRHVYEQYRFGGSVSPNQAKADQYLHKAAQFGSEWAILLLAGAQEKSAPKKALEAYLKLARNDNCIAQLRLGQAYESGDLVKKNLTQSYFWFLLADVDTLDRTAEVPFSASSGISSSDLTRYFRGSCGSAANKLGGMKAKAEETLSTKLVQVAQDAATNWSKGKTEKLLPPPPITDEAVPDTKVATALPGVKESSPKLLGPNTADMRAWIGKYPHDRIQGSTFLGLPQVQLLINKTAIGPSAISEMQGMATVGPIREEDGWLIAGGCEPHNCAWANWILAIPGH